MRMMESLEGRTLLSFSGPIVTRDGAGPALRVADFNRALRDDDIDAVWCLRGGYGAMRILDAIDYDAAVRRPKPLIGYSDITALHSAFALRSDMVTFHGPTARAALSEFSRRSLSCAVVNGGDSCGVASGARVLCGGVANGMLAGGNLALVAVGATQANACDLLTVAVEAVDGFGNPVDQSLGDVEVCAQSSGVTAVSSNFGTVTADPRRGRLLIDVRYRVRVTNTFYNLVYPFYLVEGDRATEGGRT